jgi:hypothetical protein
MKMTLKHQPLVGLVGWRGMVGSVLMDRMQAEGDFGLIEPVFFSTSNAGGKAPAMMLNIVDLPAPFGPINPRISPSSRVKDTSVFAAKPPNCRQILSTRKRLMAQPFVRQEACGTECGGA